MTALEKVAKALVDSDCSPLDHDGTPLWVYKIPKARAAIESLRTPGIEHTDRIFNVMLDRILKEEV